MSIIPIKTLLVTIVGGFLISIIGCGPHPAKYADNPSVESTERVVFVDQRLRNDLRVESLGMQDAQQNSRLVVKVKVRNLRDKAIECRVKYKFKDDSGFVVDESNWMPIVFDRREVTQLEQKSLSTKATDFTVMLRYEKEIKLK